MGSLLIKKLLPPEVELTFKVASAGTTTDAVGNVVPNSSTITHCVHLGLGTSFSSSERQEIQQLAGMDSIRYPLRGITCTPFPDSVKHMNPMIASCTWDGLVGTLRIFRRQPTGQEALSGEKFLAVFVED